MACLSARCLAMRGLAGIALLMQASCGTTIPPEASYAMPVAYDFTKEGRFPEPPHVSRAPTSVATPPQVVTLATHNEVEPRQGWRVQVFAGYSLEIAQNIQRDLQGQRSEGVYIDHVEPYYKVRIGDCAERATCEELRRQLLSQGRESAWVVPSIIHR